MQGGVGGQNSLEHGGIGSGVDQNVIFGVKQRGERMPDRFAARGEGQRLGQPQFGGDAVFQGDVRCGRRIAGRKRQSKGILAGEVEAGTKRLRVGRRAVGQQTAVQQLHQTVTGARVRHGGDGRRGSGHGVAFRWGLGSGRCLASAFVKPCRQGGELRVNSP